MQANGMRRASCAQLSRTSVLGRCPAGAAAVAVTVDLVVKVAVKVAGLPQPVPVPLAAAIPPGGLQRLAVQAAVVATNGSAATIEQARTILQAASPTSAHPPPSARATHRPGGRSSICST